MNVPYNVDAFKMATYQFLVNICTEHLLTTPEQFYRPTGPINHLYSMAWPCFWKLANFKEETNQHASKRLLHLYKCISKAKGSLTSAARATALIYTCTWLSITLPAISLSSERTNHSVSQPHSENEWITQLLGEWVELAWSYGFSAHSEKPTQWVKTWFLLTGLALCEESGSVARGCWGSSHFLTLNCNISSNVWVIMHHYFHFYIHGRHVPPNKGQIFLHLMSQWGASYFILFFKLDSLDAVCCNASETAAKKWV